MLFKKIVFYSLILSCVLSLYSCNKMLIKQGVNRDIVSHASYFTKGDQRIIYLPMMHIAKPKNYENVKTFLESKRAQGYKIFYETVKFDKNDPEARETQLKMRRLTGLKFGERNVSNGQQKIFEILDPDKYVLQKEADYGLNYDLDIHADYYLKDLIKIFEQEYTSVELDSCDYATPMNAIYTCSKKEYYDEVVHDLRNKKLMEFVLDTMIPKKVIVYGEGHFWSGFYSNIERTYNYKEVNRRKWVD